MWKTMLLTVGLAGVLAACGGEPEAPPAPAPTPPTTAAPAAAVPAPAADAYELDVIVEGEPDEGPPPLTVKFLGYIEEDEGGPWTFAWDFGDGSKSAEQNPTYTYEKEGEYTASLTVTDQRGYTGNDEIDIFVENDE